MDETASTTPTAVPVTTIATLGQFDGQTIILRGWLYNLRESGKLLFPDLPRRHRLGAGGRAEVRRFAGDVCAH